MRRYIEAAFRHKLRLALIALIVFSAAVGALIFAKRGYTSTATIWIDRPVYFTDASYNNSYLNMSPAENQASIFNELLRTRQFTLKVAQAAGIPMPTAQEEDRVVDDLQRNLSVDADGVHLIRMTITSSKPDYTEAAINHAIVLFVQEMGESQARQSESALRIYQTQLASNEEQMNKSRDALNNYLRNHPEAAVVGAPPNVELTDLQQQYANDRQQYEDTLRKIDDIATHSGAESDLNSAFFRVVDQPKPAQLYVPGAKDLLRDGLVGGGAALLALLLLVLADTWLDNRLHSLTDINALLAGDPQLPPRLLVGLLPYVPALDPRYPGSARDRRRQRRQRQPRADYAPPAIEIVAASADFSSPAMLPQQTPLRAQR